MRCLRPTLAAIALVGAGCGGNAVTGNEAASTPPVETIASSTVTPQQAGSVPATRADDRTSSGASSIVPVIDVVDVATGRTVSLRATIATDRPTLIWMWAPH